MRAIRALSDALTTDRYRQVKEVLRDEHYLEYMESYVNLFGTRDHCILPPADLLSSRPLPDALLQARLMISAVDEAVRKWYAQEHEYRRIARELEKRYDVTFTPKVSA